MSKSFYREYFAQCRNVIKLTYICRLCGVSLSNFSKFMNGTDWIMSLHLLDRVYNTLQNELRKFT